MGSSSKITSNSKFEITDLEIVAVLTTFRDISKQTWQYIFLLRTKTHFLIVPKGINTKETLNDDKEGNNAWLESNHIRNSGPCHRLHRQCFSLCNLAVCIQQARENSTTQAKLNIIKNINNKKPYQKLNINLELSVALIKVKFNICLTLH